MNVFNNAILARNRQLPDDDRMIETCRSIFKSFNVNYLSVCIGWCADQGIDICFRIRSGPQQSAILLAKSLVSFLQVRISKMLLLKSFILCCICNKSVVEVSSIESILPVDYVLPDADPVFRVSLHLLLRCSQTPRNSM